MCVLLLLSSFVTSVLIPPHDYVAGGKANGRAIAFIAHHLYGSVFGTIYDLSTILILWFAGASAMTGLLSLIPRYLPRFGMAPGWVAYTRPLIFLVTAINVVVTIIFKADVDAQGGAYATGVLVLILSAAVAVALTLHKEGALRQSVFFWALTAIFAYTLIRNVMERTDGIIIASFFIFAIITTSFVSRFLRAKELRISGLKFVDTTSQEIWRRIVHERLIMVPIRHSGAQFRQAKLNEVTKQFVVDGKLAFIHVQLIDNRSDFWAELQIAASMDGDNVVIEVSGANSVANTLAYLSELLHPSKIYIGLTGRNLMAQAFRFLLWGEGEAGLMLYQILIRYWESRPNPEKRPLIFLMTE
jgi:hypothetical protein